MCVRDFESFIVLSNSTAIIIQVPNYVQVDRSKSGCNDVGINLYITHVMIVQTPPLPTPLASWQIKGNHHIIRVTGNLKT